MMMMAFMIPTPDWKLQFHLRSLFGIKLQAFLFQLFWLSKSLWWKSGQEVVEASKPSVLWEPLSLGSEFADEIWVLQSQYQHFVFFPPIVKVSFFSVIWFLVWVNKLNPTLSRHVFGANVMEQKLRAANVNMDSWFTGADFPYFAVAQLSTAVRRRCLGVNPDICIFLRWFDQN